MIRINQLKLSITHKNIDLKKKAAKVLKISVDDILGVEIFKRSIDARNKSDILYVYTVDVELKKGQKEAAVIKRASSKSVTIATKVNYQLPKKNFEFKTRPVVVGMGPAGMFCGLYLAKLGCKPLIIERGEAVEERIRTVETFFETNKLNKESNIQFGEGGAGTFSDGKLNTLVKDKDGRNREVLKTFVEFGANEEILYDNKPHIGTDVLCDIVKNIRNEIIRLGGEILFNTKLVDIEVKNNELTGIKVENNKNESFIACNKMVLALGHSARDTFEMLYDKGISMTAKSFAMGVRVEHPQEMINEAIYGENKKLLEAANYKLTYTTSKGRGVYSFCMCPGGYVVNASSEEGRLAINGMSYSKRDGQNANSAIIVTVTPEDYGNENPLSGMNFQRRLEEKAYKEGNGKIPLQLYGDFCENVKSEQLGDIIPCTKGGYSFSNLRDVLPEFLSEALIEGIHNFKKTIPDFDRKDTIMLGVESRTSSPIRIVRDENGESSIKGIYPCGEGAGYAGGITSAAMDGLKVFENVLN